MVSKQCIPSNSGANLGLKRVGFCLVVAAGDGFGYFLVVSGSAVEEVAFVLGLEDNSFLVPLPKEKPHFWPCTISKWLNIDIMVMLLRFADIKKLVKEVVDLCVIVLLYQTMRSIYLY
ncbi:hypothetical protein V8G54_008847 [Vigna mungo]|uniref:Uncharacterized protein n=1 Tax=Vigna mungo TaxID=3915 RepID=A0AAQ3P4L4_VIGMU